MGFGNLSNGYPSYRSFYTDLFINEAHNDYAQLLVETGLLGFALYGLVLAMLDRILHHGHVLKCGPRSWRTKTNLPSQEPVG